MTSAITATGLRKSFGGKIVLDGIDLEIGAGTTFSLLGPNGAGKTTTVQIMSTPVHADGARCVSRAVTWPGHTSCGDITIRRSRLASGTGEEGQP